MPDSQQDFESGSSQIKNTAEKVKSGAEDAVDIGNKTIDAAKAAPENIKKTADAIKNAPENIKNTAANTAKAIKEAPQNIKNATEDIANAAINAPENIANTARKAGNAMRQMPTQAANAACTMSHTVANGIANAPTAIANGAKALPKQAVKIAKKAPKAVGKASLHVVKNIGKAALDQVIALATGAAGFLLIVLIICGSLAVAQSLSTVLGDDQISGIRALFKSEDRYNEWNEKVYEEYFPDTLADDGITDDNLQFAVVLSAYHYSQTGTPFVTDTYTFDDYIQNFKTEKQRSEILDAVSKQTGYEISDDDRDKIMDAVIGSTTGGELVDGDASKVTPSGTSDGSTFNGGPGTNRYNQAVSAFRNTYGNVPFYGNKLQCVAVSEWYLVKVYGAHYAGGNGRDIVGNALANDSDKLIRLTDWTAGAVFSVQGIYPDVYGHTGYVAKVDKAAGMVWLTEAWGSDGTYHENRPWTLSAFYAYYGTAVSFCIGRDYYNQLQQKAS